MADYDPTDPMGYKKTLQQYPQYFTAATQMPVGLTPISGQPALNTAAGVDSINAGTTGIPTLTSEHDHMPAPPTPPPTPAPPVSEDWATYAKRLGLTGSSPQDYANNLFKEGSMGRATDSYKPQTDENLARLQAGLGGYSTTENQALQEQGISRINKSTAHNLERYAGVAGAAGLQGPASAALQGRALNQSNQQMADFQRQMIIDNVNQKNIASQAYTGALGSASDRALDINKYNIGQGNAELYGRSAMPFQIASGMSADDAAAWAKYYGGRQLDIAQQGVDAFKNTGGYGGYDKNGVKTGSDGTKTTTWQDQIGAAPPDTPGAVAPIVSNWTDPSGGTSSPIPNYADTGQTVDPSYDPTLRGEAAGGVVPTPVYYDTNSGTFINRTTGAAATPEEQAAAGFSGWEADPSGSGLYRNSTTEEIIDAPTALSRGITSTEGGAVNGSHPTDETVTVDGKTYSKADYDKLQGQQATHGCCYVVTAATELGITPASFLRATTDKCPTKPRNGKAYSVWGPKWAALSKRNRLARAITRVFLVPTVMYMRGLERSTLGLIGYYGLYMPFTLASKVYLRYAK